MANDTTATLSPLGQSFGNLTDITDTIAFSKWIVNTLDAIFLKDPIFVDNERFSEMYEESRVLFNRQLDYYEKLAEDYENPIHAKQLIDLLYDLYQAGLTKTLGNLKRTIMEDFWEPLKNLGRIPLKKILELLELINIYLGSLSKALQSADAIDEAKKYGEHILTSIDSDLEREVEIKREISNKPKKGGSFVV